MPRNSPQHHTKCSKCQTPLITVVSNPFPVCMNCRKLARMKHCLLCRDEYDPGGSGSKKLTVTCPECRTLYLKRAPCWWIPLLAPAEEKNPDLSSVT